MTNLPVLDHTRVDLLAKETVILEQLRSLWITGWQPVEVVRQVERWSRPSSLPARQFEVELVRVAIAHDYGSTDRRALDDRWIEQIAALGLRRATGRPGWLEELVREQPTSELWLDRIMSGLAFHFKLMAGLPIEPLMRHPSIPGWSGPANGMVVSDPLLERVRHLLAKAESTTFEPEAEAFTLKAHELIARYSIDQVPMTDAGSAEPCRPVTARLAIDDPYLRQKCVLISRIARVHHCRTSWYRAWGILTLVGFPADVAAVELLSTSLLLQAQEALMEIGRQAPSGSEERTKAFRSAFIVSFGQRMSERLRESNNLIAADRDVETGGALLPMLRSRSAEVDVVYDRMFGNPRAVGSASYDSAGWARGRIVADNARLGSGELR